MGVIEGEASIFSVNTLKLSKIYLLLAFVMIFSGCGGSNNAAPSIPSAVQFSFAKAPASAVLTSGDADDTEIPVFITDPSVIKDSSGYHLFITAQFCDLDNDGVFEASEFDLDPTPGTGTLSCVAAGQGMGATMYAHSTDQGETWTVRKTPVIKAGPSEWDNEKIETPFVFVYEDTLYLLYCATGDRGGTLFTQRFQIGVASLALNGRTIEEALVNDLATFTKLNGGTAPLLSYNVTTSDLDNNFQEPSVVVRNGRFELFYTGLKLSNPALDLSTGNGNSITGIGLFRRTFDTSWNQISGPEDSFDPGPVERGEETLDIQPLNIADVTFFQNEYHIFYTTLETDTDFHSGERIAHARSSDGLTWSAKEVILVSEPNESDFDGWGIMAPTVVFEDTEAVLFYTAWGSVGANACVMSGAGAKWGQNVASSTKCVHGNLGRATSSFN